MALILSRNNLLILMAVLVTARFILLPLFDWQEGRVAAIEVKARQVNKVSALIASAKANEMLSAGIKGKISWLRGSLFPESESIKLSMQQSIRKILADNNVTMTSFEWSFDEYEGPLRTLKATILFNGTTEGMIRSLVLLRSSQKVIKIAEWRQRFTQSKPGDLGTTRGSMVVEFYTIAADAAVSQNANSEADGNE